MSSFWLAARLLTATVALYAIGLAAGRVLVGTWFEQGAAPGGRAAHRILLGEVALVLWLYLRSAFEAVLGGRIPLGRCDALVLLVILAVVAWRRNRISGAGAAARSDALFLVPLAVALGAVAWLELPRVVMLSSDPDQHAFMARQIQRLGSLPYFTQREWGTSDFDYPGGFAILNFAWATLSGLDVRDVVQAQGVVQALLAFQVLFETALAGGTALSVAGRAAASTSLVAVFFLLLPYGYQPNLYHLEGTGRAACLLFLAGGVAMALEAARRRGEPGFEEGARLGANALVGASVLAVAGLVNVVIVPYLGLCLVAAIVLLGRRSLWRPRLQALLVLACGPGLLLLDPYYIKRAFPSAFIRHATVTPVASAPRSFFASLADAAVGVLRQPRSAVLDAFSMGIVGSLASLVAFVALAAVGLVLVRRGTLRLAHVIAPSIGVLALVAARAVVLPTSLALADRGAAFYLLPPYLEAVREQLMYLALVALVAAVVAGAARAWGPVSTVVVAVTAALLIHPVARQGRLHRRPYPGSLGNATADDLVVISGIERLHQSWRDTTPGTAAHSRTPRILVPNLVLRFGREEWLFPSGAARILPLYDVFPVAFFYFQGNPDYTYDSYIEHVCRRLDRGWLKAHDIQYLFVPSDRGDVCVAGLADLLSRNAALTVRSGDSMFVDLGVELTER